MPSPSTLRLPQGPAKLTRAEYADGVLGWNRAMLARAITLIEIWSLVDEQIRETLQETDAIRRVAEDAERQVRVGALSPVLGAQAIVRALRSSGMIWGRAEEPAACAEAAS